MPFTISHEAVAALEPVNLHSPIAYDQDTGVLTATDGTATAVQIADIVLAVELLEDDSFIILALDKEDRLTAYCVPTLPQEIRDTLSISTTSSSSQVLDPSAKVSVIVSTKSGTGLSQSFFDKVLHPTLRILSIPFDLIVTSSAESVREFARQRWDSSSSSSTTTEKETVILLSGDGGIVDLLNGINTLTQTPPTIAIIPLGTGNALFHSLHLPHYTKPTSTSSSSPLTLALRALFHGRPAPLPTFDVLFPANSHLVSNHTPITRLTGAIVASYGFHAQLVWESDTPAYRQHGAARFGMVAAELLKTPHNYRADVSPCPLQNEFNYILVTMVSNLEKTFAISPASKPLDGVLRLVWFGGMDGKRIGEIMGAAYAGGSHVGMEGVGYKAVGGEVSIVSWEDDARWRKVCVDGTIVEIPRGEAMVVKKSDQTRLAVAVLDV